MRAIISHPGLQHSHQLALSLDENDSLMLYISGYPFISTKNKSFFEKIPGIERIRDINIVYTKRLHVPFFPMLAKIVVTIFPSRIGHLWQHLQNYFFDFLVSLVILYKKPDIVIAYENSAKLTFLAAKKVKAFCILDASSVHPDIGRDLMRHAGQSDPEWINRWKRREIELADLVISCSPFAAETYRHVVSPERLKVATLGTELRGLNSSEHFSNMNRPLNFVFVGPAGFRKGSDLLLDVFQGFQKNGRSANLTFVGSILEPELVSRIEMLDNVHHYSSMNQSKLFDFLFNYDCLVLPSRFDSFGMVVPECMALGIPAIVSDQVGAKCIIEENPKAGWIVPCTVEGLRDCINILVEHPEMIQNASPFARIAAEKYSWPAYRKRVFGLIDLAYREAANGLLPK